MNNYRELKEKEEILPEDELYDERLDRWLKTYDGGYGLVPKDTGFKYRRPIQNEN